MSFRIYFCCNYLEFSPVYYDASFLTTLFQILNRTEVVKLHYMTFKIVNSLYSSHCTTFCLQEKES